MKALAVIGLLFFSLFNLSFKDAYTYSPVSEEDTLQWQPNYRLQLEDFKAKPDVHSNHAAITATQINYYLSTNSDNIAIVHTEAVFYKNESWLNRELVADYNYTLKHEQGHFDIAEVFARRMQIAMNKFLADKTNADVDLQNLYDDIVLEQQQMQRQYDRETQNSTNARKQYEWNKKIHAMLQEREID